MKRLFPFFTLLLSPFIAGAAEAPDTIMVSGTHATVIESPTGVSVTLNGATDDPNFRYSFKADYPDGTSVKVNSESDFNLDLPFIGKKRSSCNNPMTHRVSWYTGNFMIGFAGGVDIPQGVKVNMGRSLEFDILNALAVQFNTGRMAPKISLGFGFGLRQLRAKNSFIYVKGDDDAVMTAPVPEGSHGCKTTLYGFNLDFPLRVCQPLGEGWEIMAAASLDVLTHCSISHCYKIGNQHYNEKWTDVERRPIGYSIIGALGNDDFGLFCKWTPKGMVKEGFGPQVSTLSVGFILGI